MRDEDGAKKEALLSIKPELETLSACVDTLIMETLKLKERRQQLFNEFNSDVPDEVKEDRVQRSRVEQSASPAIIANIQIEVQCNADANSVNERPSDAYYMIDINCKHRATIKTLEKEVNQIY